jgi:hypothetical protein
MRVPSPSGEARDMTWDEVDLDAKVWTVPASRIHIATATTNSAETSLPPQSLVDAFYWIKL